MDPLERELAAAWRVNHEITLELLALVSDDCLDLKPGSGKTIRSNIVHIAGVRRQWAEDKAREAAAKVSKPDWRDASRDDLVDALETSSEAVLEAFARRFRPETRAQWSPVVGLAYLVAHEAHHRGQIEIALRINGHGLPDEQSFALWGWNARAARLG